MYHTALSKGKQYSGTPAQVFHGYDVFAFVHDIEQGLTEEHMKADFLYTELTWKAGIDSFYMRVGKTPPHFNEFMTRFTFALKPFEKPIFIIAGKESAAFFPDFFQTDILFSAHGNSPAILYSNRKSVWPATTELLMMWLVKSYKIGTDPCCGYGNLIQAARSFSPHTKIIASDFNALCIGYIAETFK